MDESLSELKQKLNRRHKVNLKHYIKQLHETKTKQIVFRWGCPNSTTGCCATTVILEVFEGKSGGYTLGTFRDIFGESIGLTLYGEIMRWTDRYQLSFKQIADKLEKELL